MKQNITKNTLRVFCCLVVTVFLLNGCAETRSNNKDNMSGNESEVVEKYVIFSNFDYAMNVTSENDNDDNREQIQVKAGVFSNFKLAFSTNRNNYKTNEVPKSKVLKINERTLYLNYDRSYDENIAAVSNSAISSMGIYDVYQGFDSNEKRTVDVFVRRESDLIVRYIDYQIDANADKLTESEAIEKAEDILKSMYGEAIFPKYTYKLCSNNGENGCTLVYARYVNGYETDENIRLKINSNGGICSVNALNLGIFDYVNVSKEQIEAADKVISEKLPDEYYLADKYLTVDSKGDCYLYYCISTGSLSLYEYYINII